MAVISSGHFAAPHWITQPHCGRVLPSAGASCLRKLDDMPTLSIVFDLTTSREYKGQNPVGIVRTEREIAKALLLTKHQIQFFYFDPAISKLALISSDEVEGILGITGLASATVPAPDRVPAATANDDELRVFLDEVEASVGAQARIQPPAPSRLIHADESLELFEGDVLISAGLLWDSNFFEIIYRLKQHVPFTVIQVVYDIVPVLVPEFCVPGMDVRFPKYLLDVAWTADAVYCISDSTLNDLAFYLRDHGLPTPDLHRIQLGVDVATKGRAGSRLQRGLEPGRFVVYVSTIEPRKNHALLFHVWRHLHKFNPDVLVPLVIVGRQGWNSGDLLTMVQAAGHLHPNYIKLLTEVSDADLDWLYRNSSFTVYPSFYEGWGLPVAESLARGKFCIAANTSSIPEVAAGHAELINPLDVLGWVERIEHFLTLHREVTTREELIAASYKTVPWSAAMQDFIASVETLMSGPKLVGETEH